MAAAQAAGQAKSKGGLMAYLPLLIAMVVVPVGAWFGLDFLNKDPSKKDEAKEESEKDKVKGPGAPPRLPIPITYRPLVFVPGDPKKGQSPRIVTTNALVANNLSPEEFIITFADNRKKHYARTQILVAAKDTDALLMRLNENTPKLYESIQNHLSSKYFKDTHGPAFRNLLRTELLALTTQILGSNTVEEIIIPSWLIQ